LKFILFLGFFFACLEVVLDREKTVPVSLKKSHSFLFYLFRYLSEII